MRRDIFRPAAICIEESAFYRRLFRGSNRLEKDLILLNPGKEPKDIVREYHLDKIEEFLRGLCATLVLLSLSVVIFMYTGHKNRIEALDRPDYLQSQQTVELQVRRPESSWEDLTVTVGGREYTEQETKDLLDAAEDELDGVILGENTSADEIRYSLNFPGELMDGSVTAAYNTSDLSVLDASGMIDPQFGDEDGRLIEVRATLLCQNKERLILRSFMIYPAYHGEEEAYRRGLENEIRKLEETTRENVEVRLPSEYAGESVQYRRRGNISFVFLSILVFLAVLLSFAVKDERVRTRVTERNTQLLIDYPEMVSKLTVFLGAGMTVKWAFIRIASDYEKRKKTWEDQKNKENFRFAYEELLLSVRELGNGVPEERVYEDYGKRCRLLPYMRLGGYLATNVRNGNKKLLETLREEVTLSNEERKRLAKKQGEIAGTKALVPMILMLMVTIIIVIYPAFTSFQI